MYEADPGNPAFTRLTATFALVVKNWATRLAAQAFFRSLDSEKVHKDHIAALTACLAA